MSKVNVSQSDVAKYTVSPLSSKKVLTKPATSMQMFIHYLKGKGEALNLDNLGAKKLVSASILKENAFDKEGSVQRRFLVSVAKKFQDGVKGYTFNNSYNVGKEIGIWAFGRGTISGEFIGKVTKLKTGDFSLVGEIRYKFSDVFEDPYDTFNLVGGSWDPNGTPYKIINTIIHKVSTTVTAAEANKK